MATITTITSLSDFDGRVILDRLFWMLDVAHVEGPTGEVPLGPLGSIVSLSLCDDKDEKITRGTTIADKKPKKMKKTKKKCPPKVEKIAKGKRPFRNAISLWISMEDKAVCAKICSDKIHISGAYSTECVSRISDYLLGHIQKASRDLEYLKGKDVKPVIDWIHSIYHTSIPRKEEFLLNSGKTGTLLLPPVPPACLDQRIASIILGNYFDIRSLDVHISLIMQLLASPFIGVTPTRITYIDHSMCNYRKDFGKRVDRKKLLKHLTGTNYPGCIVRFNNTIHHGVFFIIREISFFESLDPSFVIGEKTYRKIGGNLHTCQIFTSGKVTLVSRDSSTSCIVNDFLMRLFEENDLWKD